MKVLIVHNDYGKFSGEEAVVEKMKKLFEADGHEVAFYRKSTANYREKLSGMIKGFFAGIYSPSGIRGMKEALEQEKPDIVNIHNLYPFISPQSLFECKKKGVPVVMTVHNYRLVCPTGLFMREGRPCEYCLEHDSVWGCVRYNCEHSFMKSLGYAARSAIAQWTKAYAKNVDRFACLTEFQRRKLIQAGYDAEKITVIPNSVDAPSSYVQTEGHYVAYLGRLSYEKGYDLLAEVARRHPEIEFRFAGANRNDMEISFPDNVILMGYLKGEELTRFLDECRFVVMPSRCYEGFAVTILEAAQHGKPTIAPDHGGFTEIIGKEKSIGRLFIPGEFDSLEQQVVSLWNAPQECHRLGAKAFEKLKTVYSTEVISRQWESLLEELVSHV